MTEHLSPYLLLVGVLVVVFATYWRSKKVSGLRKEARDHGFAAVRVLYPEELRPYFGVYAPGLSELVGVCFIGAWFVALLFLAFVLTAPTWATALACTAGALVVAVAGYAESRSRCVIGPDAISYVSVLRALSWSVPLGQVSRCEVVPGKPHNRLRVCTSSGNRLLPLTSELWKALSAGYA